MDRNFNRGNNKYNMNTFVILSNLSIRLRGYTLKGGWGSTKPSIVLVRHIVIRLKIRVCTETKIFQVIRLQILIFCKKTQI